MEFRSPENQHYSAAERLESILVLNTWFSHYKATFFWRRQYLRLKALEPGAKVVKMQLTVTFGIQAFVNAIRL